MSFFAHGIVYTSGISSISMVLPAYRNPHNPRIDLTPVELLKAAGAHLKSYRFRPVHREWPHMESGGSIADIIKLQYNTKLEVVVIDDAESSIVEAFMEGLIRHPKPYLRLLRINMNSVEECLDVDEDYALMDDALSNNFKSQPPIHELRVVSKPSLVIEIPNMSHSFVHGPQIDNNRWPQQVPEADYVRVMTSIWVQKLPRTGIIWDISIIVRGLVERVSE
ncbi:hypothetical protein H0H93_015870 [Arthromyces matolae]|nr:hypothetical protein H0H93_015870 [Arthromyces matolae]